MCRVSRDAVGKKKCRALVKDHLLFLLLMSRCLFSLTHGAEEVHDTCEDDEEDTTTGSQP
jgi:hypothetical protein